MRDKKGIGVLQLVDYVALAAFVVIAAILEVRLVGLGILPGVFLTAYGALCAVFALILWLVRRKKVLSILLVLLAVIWAAAMVYGLAAVNKVDQTVEQVTTLTETETSQIAVLVLDSDKAETVGDLYGYQIGYPVDCGNQIVQRVMAEIAAQGGRENECTAYGDTIQTADALLSGEMGAIFINAAYVDMIDELEDYAGFADQVRVLLTLDIVEEKPVEAENSEGEQTEPVEPAVSAGKDAFIVYISGIDTYGNVSTRSRSDVNILAVVNTSTRQVQLINTPRDYYVPLPNSNGTPDKLTHAGIYGIETSIGALEMLYDIQVDYYVRMNFTGFQDIIDAMGGIDVYSEYDFTAGAYHYNVGINHLTGAEALAFARERHAFAAGDVQRGINQMAVVTAMISKLTSTEVLYHYADVLDSISNSFQTNFTSDEIYSLVRQQLQSGGSWSIQSMTVTGTGASKTTYSMPGTKAYVMLPDESQIAAAKEKIEAVFLP